MLDPDLVQRIRSIFLHQEPYVSICDAASLLGWSRQEMEAAVAAGEIDVVRTWKGDMVGVQEVVAKARERWPAEVIEEALGREAALVLPRGLRTRKVTARLPLYQVVMLEYLARQRQTTIGHLLAGELDDLAGDHFDELTAVIGEFGEAFDWPHDDGGQVPC